MFVQREENEKWCRVSTSVDGRNPANQLRLVVYPIIYQGFMHLRWLFGISAINSIMGI